MNKLILLLLLTTALFAIGQTQAPQIATGNGPSIQKLAIEEVNGWNSWSNHISVIASPKVKPTKLVKGQSPAWSPDGNKIAYCIRDGGFGQIQVINADGSGHMQLTKLEGGACLPDWSPDGQKLVFTADYSAKTTAIFVMDRTGQNVTRITAGYGARWSPDGKKIVFCRRTVARDASGSIWIANSDGTGATKVIDDNSPVLEAVWFPDGKSIVFSSEREHQHRSALFRVNADGTGLELFAGTTGASVYFPVPSPDGKQIIADVYPKDSPARLGEMGDSQEGSVMLFDLISHSSRMLAHGIHPSVLWEKP